MEYLTSNKDIHWGQYLKSKQKLTYDFIYTLVIYPECHYV